MFDPVAPHLRSARRTSTQTVALGAAWVFNKFLGGASSGLRSC